FVGTPPAGYRSYLTNAVVELVARGAIGLRAEEHHALYVDSAVIRQTGQAVQFTAPGATLFRSRVDTTTNRGEPAVTLGDSSRFMATVVRGAAGAGILLSGTGVQLNGGRVEGSGGPGLMGTGSLAYAKPVRVVGGHVHPAELPLAALARLYPAPADQDSLLGNARDTIYVLGGPAAASFTARQVLPWRVRATVAVQAPGILRAEPGAVLVFDAGAGLRLHSGGRILARGSQAAPVLFTAEDHATGWIGIYLDAASTITSYLTNVRIEYADIANTAVTALGAHTVYVDSAVLRQNGIAAWIVSPNSRLVRTRVDTTLAPTAAVELGSNARIESTLIRASSGAGLSVLANTVMVISCEVRGSVNDGIVLHALVRVRNCNLVDNLGAGLSNQAGPTVADAEGNWWGDAGGPNAPAGDGVSGAVDFTPFRTTPYVLPYVP
ncbi:MAG TPA: right-handed parallel beta-helix repeat-containing protein, partial [Longimicrobiaceae bacterium]|nr:right-handed parallel beta-helix repeat-containing protein [Longimicrobiaceae bacterium]